MLGIALELLGPTAGPLAFSLAVIFPAEILRVGR
jgi:hypothetical protein